MARRNLAHVTTKTGLSADQARRDHQQQSGAAAFILQRVTADPSTLSTDDILTLQRTIGNRATSGIVKRNPTIQAKLRLGSVNDAYEQEADQVAQQVVQRLQQAPVQRKDEERERQYQPSPIQMQHHDAVGLPSVKRHFVRPHVQRETSEEEEVVQMQPTPVPVKGRVTFDRQTAQRVDEDERDGGTVSGDSATHVSMPRVVIGNQRGSTGNAPPRRVVIGNQRNNPLAGGAAQSNSGRSRSNAFIGGTPPGLVNGGKAEEQPEEGFMDKAVKKKRRFMPSPALVVAGIGGIAAVKEMVSICIDLKELAKELGALILEGLMKADVIENVVSLLRNGISKALDVIPFDTIMNVASDAVPIIGGVMGTVGSIIRAVMNVFAAKKRIQHAHALRMTSKNATGEVAEVATYGFRKVVQSACARVYESVASIGDVLKNIGNLVADIGAAASWGASEGIRIGTATYSLGRSLVDVGRSGYRAIKGIYKAIKGTRTVARFENAETLLNAAVEGDEQAQQLIISLGLYKPRAILSRQMRLGAKSLLADLQNIGGQMKKSRQDVRGQVMETVGIGGKQPANGTRESSDSTAKTDDAVVAENFNAQERDKIESAFLRWGVNSVDTFLKWLKSQFSRKNLSPNTIYAVIKYLLRFLANKTSKAQQKAHLMKEFELYKENKTWRKLMISALAMEFKSK